MIGMKSEVFSTLRKIITSKLSTSTISNLLPGLVFKYSTDEKKKLPQNNHNEQSENQTKNTQEIFDYFKDTDFAVHADKFPRRIISQRKSFPEHLYLLDNRVADSIVDLIKTDLRTDPHKVIEVNPGIGVMTKKLLAAGVPVVRLMESDRKLIRVLTNLQTRYPQRIIIHEADVLNLWRIAYQDKGDGGNRVATLFSEFPKLKWGDELGLKIIATVPNPNFVRNVITDIVRQCGIASYGRPCLYLCMTPSTWMRLTSNVLTGLVEYRSVSVLFQLFFDYELLGQVPRKAFLPWKPFYVMKKSNKEPTKMAMDKNYLYVVKIEGKKNLFTDVIDAKHIQPLWYFVMHHLVTRKSRVIPEMEFWQPGCGPSLIMQDLNIYTQFGDLSPPEILKLFKNFITWDAYQNSFLPSMESCLQKMEQLTF